MSIRYIVGLTGTGKTKICLDEMRAQIRTGSNKPLIFIVPEQFTLQAERLLAQLTVGTGVFHAEALSFSRLAYRVFATYGKMNKPVLGETGKAMALRKIVMDLQHELVYYGNAVDKRGFLDNLGGIIRELFHYAIEPDAALPAHIPDGILKLKMADIMNIYRHYREFLTANYISADDVLDVLYDVLDVADGLQGASFWVDNFYGFTAQEYKVLEKLAAMAKHMTFTLTGPPTDYLKGTLILGDTFYEPRNMMKRLNRIFEAQGIICEAPILLANESTAHQELQYLGQQYYKNSIKGYHEAPKHIRIFEAANRYEEVTAAVRTVIALTREKGYRYRDIAFLMCNEGAYGQIVKNTFESNGIPIFMDMRQSVFHHPIVEYVRALLDIVEQSMSYESVFRLLKTGLTPFDRDRLYTLENYVLASGVKGRDWSKGPFEWGFLDAGFDFHTIEQLRKEIVAYIDGFTAKVKRGKKMTVAFVGTEIYNHLADQKVLNRLQLQEQELGVFDDYEEGVGTKVWHALIETLNRMVEALGDKRLPLKEYIKILEAGLSESDIGAIPPGVDKVIAGDLRRTRLPGIKALFIIGMEDTAIPSGVQTGLLNESERQQLLGAGVDMGPFGLRKAGEEQYQIYMALSKPTVYLYLSYPLADLAGSAMRPSSVVTKINRIFPKLTRMKGKDLPEMAHIAGLRQSISALVPKLSSYAENGVLAPEWRSVYRYLMVHDKQTAQLFADKVFTNRDFKRLNPPYLSKKTSAQLYSDTIYSSVSRIEQFVQCPFSYFSAYGLHAKERRLYQLRTPDLGILFHNMLDMVAATLEQKELTWGALKSSEIDLLVEQSVDAIAPTMSILGATHKNKYIVKRLKRIGKRALWALSKQAARGSFTLVGHEKAFGPDQALRPIVVELVDGRKIILTGRIDRVDVVGLDGQRYVKVIDYKSGRKAFSLQDVYYGLQLQLLTYLNVVCRNQPDALPGGMFYFRISDPLITVEALETEEHIEARLLKELKLSGLVLEDRAVISAMDGEVNGYSDIIPVYVKRDGAVGSNSSVATLNQFKALLTHGESIIREQGNELVSGNVSVSPVKQGEASACDYCLYGAICGFDTSIPGCGYRPVRKLSKEDIWREVMEDRVGDD